MMLAVLPPQATRRTSMGRCLVVALLAGAAALAFSSAAPASVVALELVDETGGVLAAGEGRQADGRNPETSGPTAIAVDHRGRLYVVDSGHHRVLVLDAKGSVVLELGGYGWAEDRLDRPLDVAIDAGLATYVLDAGNRRVVEYDAEGNYLGVVLTEEQVGTPVGLELGSGGELYVTDADAQVVRGYSQFGEPLDPIGSFGSKGGGLVSPARVAMGPSREIAVADPGASVVCLYDEFGSLLAQLTYGDGFAPLDVLFDPHGNIIAADPSAGTVVVFDRADGSVTAAVGREVLGPDVSPTGLAFDRSGRLLVLDGISGRVLTFALEYDTGR